MCAYWIPIYIFLKWKDKNEKCLTCCVKYICIYMKKASSQGELWSVPGWERPSVTNLSPRGRFISSIDGDILGAESSFCLTPWQLQQPALQWPMTETTWCQMLESFCLLGCSGQMLCHEQSQVVWRSSLFLCTHRHLHLPLFWTFLFWSF